MSKPKPVKKAKAEAVVKRLSAAEREAKEIEYLELLEAEAVFRARNYVLNFSRYTMPTYEVNWHHKALCRKLDDFVNKKITRLIITMPPRHGKTELCSKRLPAYIHGRYPDDQIMAASYSGHLASDMTKGIQAILDSPEFQRIFPKIKITPDGSRSSHARNSEEHELIGFKGRYRGQGVGGSFTGRGGNWIIIDDPIKGRDTADSPAYRKHLLDWYTSVLRTRLEKDASILIILTRWHEEDLAGALLNLGAANPEADQFELFNLPAIKEDDTNPLDIRQIGEALWPNKFSLNDLGAIRAGSTRDWNSLYQQRPSALEGGIIKRAWFQYYTERPIRFTRLVQSWDLTFKDAKTSDFVVGQVWGIWEGKKYLLDQIRERMGFTETCDSIRLLSRKWPQAYTKYIEEKANGSAVMDALRREGVAGLTAVNPKDSKHARLEAVSPQFRAGDVYFPHPSIAPWISHVEHELCSFPNAANDDCADAVSQVLNELAGRSNVLKKMSNM